SSCASRSDPNQPCVTNFLNKILKCSHKLVRNFDHAPKAGVFSENAAIVQNTLLHRPGIAVDACMRLQPCIGIGNNHMVTICITSVIAGKAVHEIATCL